MADLNKKCLDAALRLLGRRDHSRVELSRKLRRKGYQNEHIASAVDTCLRLDYLDDEKFCRVYARQLRRRGYGALRIPQMLKDKGLSSDLVEASIGNLCGYDAQLDDCIVVLEKKLKRGPSGRDENKDRLIRFLSNRGFSFDVIREALRMSVSEDY